MRRVSGTLLLGAAGEDEDEDEDGGKDLSLPLFLNGSRMMTSNTAAIIPTFNTTEPLAEEDLEEATASRRRSGR